MRSVPKGQVPATIRAALKQGPAHRQLIALRGGLRLGEVTMALWHMRRSGHVEEVRHGVYALTEKGLGFLAAEDVASKN
jgi:predicted transcriptional regulator